MNRENLEQQLRDVERSIQEVQGRMPAHSVKPTIMQELFELEDKRDELKRKLELEPNRDDHQSGI